MEVGFMSYYSGPSRRMRDIFGTPPEVDVPRAGMRIFQEGNARAFLSLSKEARLSMLREGDDQKIANGVRMWLQLLLQSSKEYREKKDSDVIEHPSGDLSAVMADVLNQYPEETFYFLNDGQLRANVNTYQDGFIPEMPDLRRIIYAMKANPRKRILKILQEEQIDGFDCASFPEIIEGLKFTGKDGIFFNHPIKKLRDIESAHAVGVKHFTAQARDEVEKILEGTFSGGVPPEIAIRLLTANHEALINLSEKFGATEDNGRALIQHLKITAPEAGVGLSIHTGSQNPSPEAFQRGIRLMTDVAESVGGVDSINVGGGIPVNYHKRDNFDIREFLEAINHTVRKRIGHALKGNSGDPKVIIEPGRSIIGNAVDLAIPVLSIQNRLQGPCLYMDDGIFGSFSDSVIHNWRYPFRVIDKDGREITGKEQRFTVFGNTCDNKDVLCGRYELPEDLKKDYYLWAPSSGAYMDTQSRFHLFEPPRYVLYNSRAT